MQLVTWTSVYTTPLCKIDNSIYLRRHLDYKNYPLCKRNTNCKAFGIEVSRKIRNIQLHYYVHSSRDIVISKFNTKRAFSERVKCSNGQYVTDVMIVDSEDLSLFNEIKDVGEIVVRVFWFNMTRSWS